jgi:hypothetical protein
METKRSYLPYPGTTSLNDKKVTFGSRGTQTFQNIIKISNKSFRVGMKK